MEKFSKKLKSFFITLFIVFVLYIALFILSICGYICLGQVLNYILFFPIGPTHSILSDYLWNYYGPSHWINDEFTQLFVFLLFVIAQTFVYYYIYKFFKARKKRKMEIQE